MEFLLYGTRWCRSELEPLCYGICEGHNVTDHDGHPCSANIRTFGSTIDQLESYLGKLERSRRLLWKCRECEYCYYTCVAQIRRGAETIVVNGEGLSIEPQPPAPFAGSDGNVPSPPTYAGNPGEQSRYYPDKQTFPCTPFPQPDGTIVAQADVGNAWSSQPAARNAGRASRAIRSSLKEPEPYVPGNQQQRQRGASFATSNNDSSSLASPSEQALSFTSVSLLQSGSSPQESTGPGSSVSKRSNEKAKQPRDADHFKMMKALGVCIKCKKSGRKCDPSHKRLDRIDEEVARRTKPELVIRIKSYVFRRREL